MSTGGVRRILAVAWCLHRDLGAALVRRPPPWEVGRAVPPGRDDAFLPMLIVVMLTLPVETLLLFVLIPAGLWWLRDALLVLSVEATLLVWGLYASLSRRQHLFTPRGLRVRWSYFTDALVPYADIARVEPRRDRNPSGQFGVTFHPTKPEAHVTNGLTTNLSLDLARPVRLSGLMVGSREVVRIHLSVDDAAALAGDLDKARASAAKAPDPAPAGPREGPEPTQASGLSSRSLVLLALALEVPLFGVGYAWMNAQGLDALSELQPTVDGAVLGLVLGLGIAALSLGSLAVAGRVRALAGWRNFVEGTLGRYLGPAGLPALVLLSVLAGLGEEVFFRGALQGAIGFVPTAAAFAMAHVGLPRRETLPFLVYVFLVGLVLGYVRLSQPLFPLVVAHALVDLIDTAYLHAAYRAARARRIPA